MILRFNEAALRKILGLWLNPALSTGHLFTSQLKDGLERLLSRSSVSCLSSETLQEKRLKKKFNYNSWVIWYIKADHRSTEMFECCSKRKESKM